MTVNCTVGERKVGRLGTEEHAAVVSRPRVKKLSLIGFLGLLTFLALSSSLGCGNDSQGDSGFSDDEVERLDRAIAKRMQENNLPGVVVGVWVPGEGRYVVARGKANLETGEERDIDDLFRIGSITKTFVATAILQLVEEGKLSKSDKLARWYPGFPNAEKITIEHLLRNYILLGEIIRKVSGNDTGDQIEESILEPLGMKDTVYPTNNDLPGDLHGYTLDLSTGALKEATSLPLAPVGAAGP